MEETMKAFLISVALFFAAFTLFAGDPGTPTVEVTFSKTSDGVIYTIVFGETTKFNTNDGAPYKFFFLDESGTKLGEIPRDFFMKNRSGTVKYTSKYNESTVKYQFPVCSYNKETGEAEKCRVTKTTTLKIK